ncbi:MAG: AbrB family transcriptional regulator [Candidatus Saccharibacteria bacterium]|jgi:AbrB family looped-hinge helix DNA binding protein|nr:AbrB family transcriptional regulator [Candidatus Saccharibacteria bacterium]
MKDKKLYGTATVGTKGQVVIPADAREILGIETGDRLYVVGSKEGKWIGLIQEEQLRSIIEQLSDNIELYKGVLDIPKANKKE